MEEALKQLQQENKQLKQQLDIYQQEKLKKRKKTFSTLFSGIKSIVVPFIGRPLKKSISKAFQEYSDSKKLTTPTISDVVASVVWRLTRVGIFSIIVAIIPIAIVLVQTSLLSKQNKLITSQNRLVEADRRSSLVFVLGEVLSDLNTELNQSSSRKISETLQARIISLCMAMKPYKIVEDGVLSKMPLSPERGQLLYTLIKSNLDITTLQDILNLADFTYSSLPNAIFGTHMNLRYARIDHSDFSGVDIRESRLDYADLSDSNFSKSTLADSDLSYTNLRSTDFSRAELIGVNFTRADLRKANLSKSNLAGSNFYSVDIQQADLSNARLVNVIVSTKDWLEKLADKDVKGYKQLLKTYKVVSDNNTYKIVKR